MGINLDVLVIRSISESMGEAVDRPDDVDADRVPQNGGHTKRVQPSLVPEVYRDQGWQHEAQNRHHLHVVPRKIEVSDHLSVNKDCLDKRQRYEFICL